MTIAGMNAASGTLLIKILHFYIYWQHRLNLVDKKKQKQSQKFIKLGRNIAGSI